MLPKQVQLLLEDDTPERAIEELKKTIKADPLNTAAIALLGELQFVEPAQPFTRRAKDHVNTKVADVVVEVRNPCNFRCDYCVAKGFNNVPVVRMDMEAIRQAFEKIDADVIVTSLECQGGEPTIHPQFAELVALCSEFGAVSFPSNNSQNPQRWLPDDHASRLYIRSALHPEGEEMLEKYTDHARYLIDAGADFACIFIAHPERMDMIDEYRAHFEKYGIPFFPSAFIGTYEDKKYPHSYSDEEKTMLGLDNTDTYWAHKIQPHTNRCRNFRGIPCLAGYKSIVIGAKGSLRRCGYDKRPLDKPLDKAEPCEINHCGCGLLLEKLNTIETPSFYASWARFAGQPEIDMTPLHKHAKELGYRSINDATADESETMYDELMRAYGKDDL